MHNSDDRCILIVATDPNIIYLLQRYAEASGFHTTTCELGGNLAQCAKQVDPVLIVMQFDSIEPTWHHSVSALKTDPMTESIPIIAYSCLDELDNCQVEGIASVLQKSMLYGDFLQALASVGIYREGYGV